MRGKSAAVVVVSVLAGLVSAPAASAELRDPHTKRAAAQDVDVRTSLAGGVAPTAAQHRAARALTGVTVVFDGASGLPTRAIRYGGAVTTKSSASAEAIARGFLADNAGLFRLSAAGLKHFVVAGEDVTRGFRSLTLQQTDAGRDVLGARLTFGIDADGRILTFDGTYVADAATDPDAELSAGDAVRVALRELGERPPALTPKWSAAGTPSRRTVFENDVARDLRDPSDIDARLVTFPMPGGRPARLAWKTLTEVNKIGSYESVVDAHSGALLARRNLYQEADTPAEGTVFTAQHPGIAGAVRSVVPFTGASFDNSGWVGSNRETNGNNVNAYQDKDGNNASDFQPQTVPAGDPSGNFQHFNYSWTNAWGTGPTPGTDVTTDQAAVVTQMFYYANKYHDYLYGLGFNEASRNFQADNFGRGPGTGGDEDAILAEADDNYLTDSCNANFHTGPDGSTGDPSRMQMFVGKPIKDVCDNNYVQRAMNGDTIFHEMTHGLSHRLVSSGSLGGGSQTDAMGEGWGDFFATSYWNDPVYGDYNNGDTTKGIRSVGYANSTLDYSNLCSGGCEEHSDGEIWATVLWDLRVKLVAKYGYSADRPDATPGTVTGNRRAEQLVVDAMKLSGTNPTFLSMRDQILAADAADYANADECLIWGVFAKRKMGLAATVGGSQGLGTTATDGPAQCTPVPNAGGPYTTPEGTDKQLSAAASTGSGLTYEWDLDNDGAYDDATGVSPTFTNVGRDGVFTIGLKVTSGDGFSATATTTVTVTNVAPVVGTITTNSPRAENTTVTVSGAVTDAGWKDPLSATINWGDASATQALTGTEEHARPDGSITYSADHVYGDDGVFTVTVCASDDDVAMPVCKTTPVTVTNVNPTATINESGATDVNGTPVLIAHTGQPVAFSGRATDPGSDDLTLRWNWGDGLPLIDATRTFLVNPPATDPDPSPSIQPRDVTDARSKAFGQACIYDVEFSALDDDGGAATDTIAVLIAGAAGSHDKSAGWWENEFATKGTDLTAAQLTCYLKITSLTSKVFNEVNDVSTFALARKVVGANYNQLTPRVRLDRTLLACWLNFANGAFDWNEPRDTNGNGVPDTTFRLAMQAAEAVRLNPAATETQLDQQRAILATLDS